MSVLRESGRGSDARGESPEAFRQLQESNARLEQREQIYRLLAENASDLVFRADLVGVLDWVSASVAPLLGYQPEQVVGRSIREFIDPRDSATAADVAQRWAGAETITDRARLRHADGSARWMEMYARPLFDDAGAVVGRAGGVRDIQAQVEAEQARAESDSLFRLLAENSSDVVFRGTNDGVIQWISPSARELTGWPPEELVGRAFLELIHPDDHNDVRAGQAAVSRGERSRCEFRVRTRAGTYRWVSSAAGPVRSPDGAVVGRVGGWRDVTEEHEAREALERSEEHFRLLAENSSDIVALAAPDREIMWIAPSVERVLGWTSDELIGTVFSDLLHPDDWSETEGERSALYTGGEIPERLGGYTLRMRTKDGQYRWVSASATPLVGDDGKPVGVVSSVRDVHDLVTTRQQSEEQRARLQATMDSLLDPHVLMQAVRDDSGRIIDFLYVDANDAACAYNGTTREQLIGARLLEILPGHMGAGLLAMYAETVESGEPLVLDDYAYPHEIMHSERRFDVRAVRVDDCLSYTWRDVTERHEAGRTLAESEERFRLLALNSTDIIMRGRKGGVVQWVSPSVFKALEWQPEEWVGERFIDFVHPEDHQRLIAGIRVMDGGGDHVIRLRLRARHGSFRWAELQAHPYVEATGVQDGAVVAMRLVDAEVAAEKELKRRAQRDDLTGLLNRNEALAHVSAALSVAVQPDERQAIMFCDVDRFKDVNDSAGHAAGDDLLRQVAQRIRSTVRRSDMVARFGGDEFLVLVQGVRNLAEAVRIGEKIRRAVCPHPDPAQADGAAVPGSTLSIGVTLLAAADSVDTAIARADSALYAAKDAGRNTVVGLSAPDDAEPDQA